MSECLRLKLTIRDNKVIENLKKIKPFLRGPIIELALLYCIDTRQDFMLLATGDIAKAAAAATGPAKVQIQAQEETSGQQQTEPDTPRQDLDDIADLGMGVRTYKKETA